MSVYVITHKNYKKPNIECYKTLLVGAYKGHILGEDVLNDDNGENISEKNANYCELTGLYWIWKNINSEDYVGLVHYRRYFCKRNIFKSTLLEEKRISKILKKYDLILPKKLNIVPNVYSQYEREHFKNDLDLCLDIINRDYPEFSKSVKTVMNADKASLFNMFIMSKKDMDNYCEWLFDILFKLEKQIDVSNRDEYQKRVFGFISERLFNIWLNHNNFKIYYTSVYDQNVCPLKLKIKRIFKV